MFLNLKHFDTLERNVLVETETSVLQRSENWQICRTKRFRVCVTELGSSESIGTFAYHLRCVGLFPTQNCETDKGRHKTPTQWKIDFDTIIFSSEAAHIWSVKIEDGAQCLGHFHGIVVPCNVHSFDFGRCRWCQRPSRARQKKTVWMSKMFWKPTYLRVKALGYFATTRTFIFAFSSSFQYRVESTLMDVEILLVSQLIVLAAFFEQYHKYHLKS